MTIEEVLKTWPSVWNEDRNRLERLARKGVQVRTLSWLLMSVWWN